MSRIAPIYSDRSRYKISHNPSGTRTVLEPVGWRNDDNEFVRDKSFHGIFLEMTNDLTFYNGGAEFLETIYRDYGINSDVIMIKEERNPRTDIWEVTYSGYLDYTTYKKKDNGISMKFISSGLLRVIKARQSEQIEIDRLDTLKGDIIPYLEPNKVLLNGRGIFLKSLLETAEEDRVSDGFNMSFKNRTNVYGSMAVPLTEIYASDVKVIPVSKDLSFTDNPNVGNPESMFYIDCQRTKYIDLKVNCSFDIIQPENKDISDLTDAELYLMITKYSGGTEYIRESVVILSENIVTNEGLRLNHVSVNYHDPQFKVLKGESLSLQWWGGAREWGNIISFGYLRPRFENIFATVNIEESSTYEKTESKVYLPFELGERLLKVITNEDNLLESEVLGREDLGYEKDGEASLIGLTHGFWVRGFSKDDPAEVGEDENRYKSMTTSFKDFYESYFNVWNLGASIEFRGFKEIFKIEKKEYFYNKNILIKLGKEVNGVFEYVQVNNVERTLDRTTFNSGIEIGYQKGAEYEEAVGLDEYNGKSTFTTIIDKIEQVFTKICKYGADSYGIEFARRFQYTEFPNEDTKYDSLNWFLDMKRGLSEVFEQRLWQDDFTEQPTGVYDPDTAQNLRLSPFNMLLRHGWVIASGLTKYPLDYIRYGSSTASSKLATTLKPDEYPIYGGKTFAENGNIMNNELERARTDGEVISFEYVVDYDLLQQIKGKTVILGKEIPNFYGLVAFKNEKGQIEEGYLDKLSPNGVGKWVVKKFNK